MKATADVRTSVSVRTCAPVYVEEEKCQKVTEQGLCLMCTVCTCNSDLCNSSTVMVGNYAAIMGILAIFYLLK